MYSMLLPVVSIGVEQDRPVELMVIGELDVALKIDFRVKQTYEFFIHSDEFFIHSVSAQAMRQAAIEASPAATESDAVPQSTDGYR